MKKISLFLIMASLILSGCQQNAVSFEDSKATQELPIPYSNGPTSSPTEMKGPNGPPPTSTDASSVSESTPKAVTETENVHLTLQKSEE